jgi:hypothetical protein
MVTTIITCSKGVPHLATNDDEYDGYYISKGTVLLSNGWSVEKNNSLLLLSPLSFLFRSILHDPNAFNNAMEYQPERYLKDGKLNPDVRDPGCAAFGFGRRWVDTTYSPTSIPMVHLP